MFSGILERKDSKKGLRLGLPLAIAGMSVIAGLTLAGCGDTGDEADLTPPGGGSLTGGNSLAKLTIDLNSDTANVGDQIGYRVKLRDANGAPMKYQRIFCDSEKGIAILEPSAGGVAFESTDENGEFSGVIGAAAPGSYLMECRAQQGFNLYDRVTLRTGGATPAGFAGWPGAAGGNLGGGTLVDPDPAPDGGEGIRITSLTVRQGGNAVGTVDFSQICDCSGATTPTSTDPEPFGAVDMVVVVQNGTAQEYRISSASVAGIVSGGGVLRYADNTTVVPARGTATLYLPIAAPYGACTVATITTRPTLDVSLQSGTASVRVVGTFGSETVTVRGSQGFPVGNVNNCSN